jgi:protein-disulfide reductase (glutathione)
MYCIGFGDEINWIPWTDAERLARELNKPIYLLIHKSWCRACKALKAAFADTSTPSFRQFVEESKYFIMVNVEDNEEPEGDRFHPDGFYFPRTLFYGK